MTATAADTFRQILRTPAEDLPADVRPLAVCSRIAAFAAAIGGLLELVGWLGAPGFLVAIVGVTVAALLAAIAWGSGWWPKPGGD